MAAHVARFGASPVAVARGGSRFDGVVDAAPSELVLPSPRAYNARPLDYSPGLSSCWFPNSPPFTVLSGSVRATNTCSGSDLREVSQRLEPLFLRFVKGLEITTRVELERESERLAGANFYGSRCVSKNVEKAKQDHPRSWFTSDPKSIPEKSNWAIMSLGALVCTGLLLLSPGDRAFAEDIAGIAMLDSSLSSPPERSSSLAHDCPPLPSLKVVPAAETILSTRMPLEEQLEAQVKTELREQLRGLDPLRAKDASTDVIQLTSSSLLSAPLLSAPHHEGHMSSSLPAQPAILTPDTPAYGPGLSDGVSLNMTEVSFASAGLTGAASLAIDTAAAVVVAGPAAGAIGLSEKIAQIFAQSAQHFGLGGIAGALGATVVYPLDTIKTRMQVQRKGDGEEPEYRDELDCLKQVLEREGVGALYSGLLPQLVGIAPEKAIKLTVNELLLAVLETMVPGARLWLLELVAGGGGGFCQVVFTNPVEKVKIRLQTQDHAGRQKTSWEVVKELGPKGLYSGSTITMARDVPSAAIFFASYVALKQMFPEQSFLAGCIAAIPSAILLTPMDVVMTRMQMEHTPGEDVPKNGWDCAMQILRHEGPEALFAGGIVRVLRMSPQFGITLMMYDLLCSTS